ncbi:hypothetical protein AWU68_0584 [Corynebacterium simulans]|uniref:Uncharacterized protein n=1 Tax=Corynebacterium simulans TaxID=146827 RepID=A0ABR5VB83_9CORY|nr:hypothetical protein AWU68_0584 [Corynebacterium simulans]KXU18475.1 hypothetical protein WM41_0888 [Corynebacterium simulans]
MPRLTIEISNQAIREIFSKVDDAPYIFGHYSSFVTPTFSIVLGN